jgi:DNA-binding GntR family transcriptional regulator
MTAKRPGTARRTSSRRLRDQVSSREHDADAAATPGKPAAASARAMPLRLPRRAMATREISSSSDPFENAQPRYLAVAQMLSKSITSGEYDVGSLLPTETELCQRFGVSRHTVREALRKLRDLGLVTRHQGVGTRVQRSEISGRYVIALDSILDMWRHVEVTEPKVVYKAIERKEDALIPLPSFPGDEVWQRVDVLRADVSGAKPVPISLSHIYIQGAFKGVVSQVDTAKVPVFSLIEKKYGQKVTSVQQEISAVLLDRTVAKHLKAPPGSPGLSIVRIYRGRGDAILQVSQAISPADRFTYGIELKLEVGR